MTDPSPRRHALSLPMRGLEGKRRKNEALVRGKHEGARAVFVQMQTERTILDARTAKLRALRLAKEESDRATALVAAVEKKKPGRAAGK